MKTAEAFGAGLPAVRRQAALGDLCSRGPPDEGAPQERTRLGDSGHRRPARLRSFGNRGLIAIDLDGSCVWQRDLGAIDAYHGTAGSPLLYKDR